MPLRRETKIRLGLGAAGLFAVSLLLGSYLYELYADTGNAENLSASATMTAAAIALVEEVATPAAEPSSTPVPNTLVPLLGNIPGCYPVNNPHELMVGDGIDLREGWNAVPGDVNTLSVACFDNQMPDALDRGIIKRGHVTTADTIADLMGSGNSTDIMIHDDIHNLSDVSTHLTDHQATQVIVPASDLSEAMVRISREFAEIGGSSADRIFSGLTRGIRFEKKWSEEDKQKAIDDIYSCVEYRSDHTGTDRLGQGKTAVDAHWGPDNRRGYSVDKPRNEVFRNGRWELAGVDDLVITMRVVGEEEFQQIKKTFQEHQEYLRYFKMNDGSYAVMIVQDFDNEKPSLDSVFNNSSADSHGSGDALVPCGPARANSPGTPKPTSERTATVTQTSEAKTPTPGQPPTEQQPPTQGITPPTLEKTPTGTPQQQNTPTPYSTENSSETPPPTDTQPAIETPQSTDTPLPTDTATPVPTDTQPAPTGTTEATVTPAPTFTLQLPIPTTTPEETRTPDATPTPVPTSTNTEAPEETPAITPPPPTQPEATGTPLR